MGTSKQIRRLTPEQHAVFVRLEELRGELGIHTAADFIRRHIAGEMSASTYGRLVKNIYQGRPENFIASAAAAVARIEDMLEVQRRQQAEPEVFFELPVFRGILDAIKLAGERTDEKRLVIYLAEQGGGKSAVCRQMVDRLHAVRIMVLPSWRKSYFASCADVCRAFGESGPWRSTKDVEGCMLRVLRHEPRLLAFDEGNTLGADSLNMIKVILNETRCTVFLAALPGLFDLMTNKAWFESAQVIRRAVAIIDLSEYRVRASDVKPFLAEFELGDKPGPIYKAIADAANRFAAFDMIKQIVENLELYQKGPLTMYDVEKAIEIAEKMWRLDKAQEAKK